MGGQAALNPLPAFTPSRLVQERGWGASLACPAPSSLRAAPPPLRQLMGLPLMLLLAPLGVLVLELPWQLLVCALSLPSLLPAFLLLLLLLPVPPSPFLLLRLLQTPPLAPLPCPPWRRQQPPPRPHLPCQPLPSAPPSPHWRPPPCSFSPAPLVVAERAEERLGGCSCASAGGQR